MFNVEDIKNSLAGRHAGVINPLIIGISAIVMILLLDPRIGLMVVGLSIISVQTNMTLSKPLCDMAVRIQNLFADCTQRLTDILAGIDIIKMFPGTRVMTQRYFDVNAEVAKDTMKRFRRMSGISALEWMFGFLCNIVILLIGVLMSFAGLLDFGTVGNPALPAHREKRWTDSANSGYDSFLEDSAIKIGDAVFSYDNEKTILNGVDITVDRGKTAALVGESGGGKSTVIKLLLGFYQLDSGTIELLGKPLEGYTPDELRKNIAYVPQDAYLFTTTIKENIRYGRRLATDEEVMEAARRAYSKRT